MCGTTRDLCAAVVFACRGAVSLLYPLERLVNRHQTLFTEKPISRTGVWVIDWFRNQASPYGIGVNVFDLYLELLLGIDQQIIETRLPQGKTALC